ncbi:helix-turn-helix domain-containing protein [Desulfovibrio psychrotolerans]|uniref:Bacteriophage CI repressor N-terminal domain-containing protein n=1 Tax=Desulfovibrio psychrotolerans TaxID=415242 RepID=A0A7J0BW68_9BACT|nr:helix-turn-helix domain-containing protein [Desulfovibrio psychrotolerans]GFM37960.1 hypothetical protein DSM19430T_26440 [Desulfovibrio psychrotolerans]
MHELAVIDILERLKQATGATSDAALAIALGVTQQAISSAKARNKFPTAWAPIAADRFGVTTDWIFFGRGPMRPEDAAEQREHAPEPAEPGRCPYCAKSEKIADDLRSELSKERDMNRELVAENRQLWKENSELRERLARLEERQNAQPVSGVPSTTGNVA